ncbi:DegT/DnrJ/EryC1/StrS family aminotransferase [Cylindrospermopsis raciborskii]|uniref:DegT/DnrJ/EryC1/StrS family aminotransferase n=1 Tax=Cylindrospermopsis raciborskii TaxID=77022 RepID=UPI0007789AB9|nr:DegT/DnrJ/EryC1/StrS family aminotransferase [Cylindrospermopsis raciborskii]
MINKVTIELPSELASKLTHQALKKQTTLEDMIVNLLSQLNENQTIEEIDSITPLLDIDQWNEGRRRAAKIYNNLLADVSGVITPVITDSHVFHQYTIRVLDGKRDKVQKYLGEQGIGTMIYYPVTQDQLPVYQGQYPKMPVSDLLGTQVLSLPIWPELSSQNIEKVTNLIQKI